MIMQKLITQIRQKSPICVGLDTALSYIPPSVAKVHGTNAQRLFAYNKQLIEATRDVASVYKVQIAYYEALGLEGLRAYADTVGYLREQGLIVIGDIKRSDIAATAEQYAKAHFAGDFEVDFVTLSPYMGYDSLTPYFPYLQTGDKGVFVLLRTSNPGAQDIEYLKVDGECLYYHIGDNLERLGKDFVDDSGYSALGMVTGGTHVEEATAIRKRYAHTPFLIPGYGAQGATASDVSHYLNQGNGGVVNASRSILLAWKKDNSRPDEEFALSARDAALKMQAELKQYV